jgi:hypothetical protein
VVVTETIQTAKPLPTAIPIPKSTPVVSPSPYINAPSWSSPIVAAELPIATPKAMSLGQLRSKIAEAKRLMQSRPLPTAMTESFLLTEIVRIAYYDWRRNQIDFIVTTKESFLTKGLIMQTVSSAGENVMLRIIRANGVNTPISITDLNGVPQTPLLVQYPVERGGRFEEIAYYTSTHPGVVNSEVVGAGRLYIKNTIDSAREKLRLKGIFIAPEIADVAERLVAVEHVDHPRFWNENRQQIYNEIFTLYAMNEGNTYRYAVSRAGAGGMVQMIPSTYYMIRSRYFGVGLIPDFVEGMRNHSNAAQAMLLYMQMTWDDLSASDTIYGAVSNGTATQAELLAAGYNSNPANLPTYIRRGGSGWRFRIPRETQTYLQIYADLERNLPAQPRTR